MPIIDRTIELESEQKAEQEAMDALSAWVQVFENITGTSLCLDLPFPTHHRSTSSEPSLASVPSQVSDTSKTGAVLITPPVAPKLDPSVATPYLRSDHAAFVSPSPTVPTVRPHSAP